MQKLAEDHAEWAYVINAVCSRRGRTKFEVTLLYAAAVATSSDCREPETGGCRLGL